jgi:hypothetical protein
MGDEEQKDTESRRLKIKGGKISGENGLEKKGPKEKESGSKKWVLLILVVSVILSLIFSFKNRSNVPASPTVQEPVEQNSNPKQGLFGPAVYEYQR